MGTVETLNGILAQANPLDPRLSQANPILEWILIVIPLFTIVVLTASWMANERDKKWLPAFVIWGFVAKIIASLARFYMVTVIYGGGDALRYHMQGSFLANSWLAFELPMSAARGEGTAFTEVSTSLVYALYTPNMVGGFLMFAFLALLGQMLYYAAFRRAFPDSKLKLYAFGVFFLPSIVFWPASVGKDSLMLLFIGLSVYGAARLLYTYDAKSWLYLGTGLFLAAQIRPHVAAMVVLAMVLAAVLARPPQQFKAKPRRLFMIGVSGVALVLALSALASTYGVGLESGEDTQDPQEFLEFVSDRTAQGGSEISGGPITSVGDIPMGTLTVLFRPLLGEGSSPEILLSSLEGTGLLLITIWQLPAMWRNRRRLRQSPLLMMAFLYTCGFIVAFSAILNLGIMARQRVQVLPMFLALLVGLGFEKKQRKRQYAVPDTPTPVGAPTDLPEYLSGPGLPPQ